MNKGVTDVVAYLSWPGLIIALIFGDRMGSRFHLNQSLVIWLAATLISIVARHAPLIGWLIGLVGGLFCAASGSSASWPPASSPWSRLHSRT